MTLALIATLSLLAAVPVQNVPPNKPVAPPTTSAPKKPPASSAATTVCTVTVTDPSGAPIRDVHVTLSGAVNRSGATQSNGVVKFDGVRAGEYRLEFTKEGFLAIDRQFEWRARQPAPTVAVVMAPPPAPPPPPAPAPEPPKATSSKPPPGKPVSLSLPDFIEKNYISNSEPQKVSSVGCSGLTQNVLWQIREPWENRQHEAADLMIYVIAGEGTLRLDGRDIPMQAGHFASVPRGSSYSLLRRGRNPLIALATLVGEPCQ
jgi:mannose-6-phosphate isomerase-like protein (cupin superfamily)